MSSRRRRVVTAVAVILVVLATAYVAARQPERPDDRTTSVTEAFATPFEAPATASAQPPAVASQPPASPSITLSAPPTSPGATGQPANTASRLRTLPASTRQVIVVSADAYGSTTARLEAFNRVSGGWVPAFGAMSARVGTAGFADRKVEGDLKTPTGVYSIGGTMYGIAGNPGVRYGYHTLVPDDWWNENPATTGYNSFVHGTNPGGASEALWQISPQYTHFAVINYNVPVVRTDPPRGSGIFLHQMVAGRATAGCVSLAQPDLLAILRWLDPAASPRIVLGPREALARF